MSGAPPGPTGKADTGRRVPLLNVANGLTGARIVIVPIFVVLVITSGMSRPGWRIAACVAFCLASATDFADGWIARGWGLVTAFGKVADPIADKALTGSALVLLSAYGRLPWWMTVVILTRELGVTGLRFMVIRRAVIAASRGGKAKTALQILAIAWSLAPFPEVVAGIGWWLMLAATAVTVVTGLDYAARALRLARTEPPDAGASPPAAGPPSPGTAPAAEEAA